MSDPIGAVLAGGAGRRIGGAKATVKLRGRPLISYPLYAAWQALGTVAVVAKRDTELPALPGVTVWIEPDQPQHPLAGIVHALRCAQGRAVVVCAGDLPLVSEALIHQLATADTRGAPALVAAVDGRLQPTLGCYLPQALQPLSTTLQEPLRPLSETVLALGAHACEVADPDQLLNVNTPEDLLRADAMLDRRRLASRT